MIWINLPGDAITAPQLLAFDEVTEAWFLLLNLFKELALRRLLDLVIRGSGGKLFSFSSFTWDMIKLFKVALKVELFQELISSQWGHNDFINLNKD